MLHTSYIEISKSALKHNIKFIKEHLHDNVLLSSVVKGNAYGHGIEQFVPIAEDCGVNHFSVFSADEAQRVKQVLQTNSDIMIMGMLDTDQLEWAISNEISFFVFNFERIENTLKTAKRLNKKARIHIEIETGMNRTGFLKKNMNKLLSYITQNLDYLNIEGFCTHFAGAESISNFYRVQKQIKLFKNIKKEMNLPEFSDLKFHAACSAAAIRYPKTQMDMVRIGILQYGFFPTKEVLIDYLSKSKSKNNPLKRIISWKSEVMDVKKIKMGEFIGYGTSYFANNNMKIAIVPVGYGHGFSRSLSNRGRVIINGHLVNVVGIVNMNMMSVDVTDLNEVKVGDQVVIIGKQGNFEISVGSFSDYSEQVNYELLTRLPGNLPRIVVE
ncbi:alanine racemase [Zhouia amylolytica]|uniref:Alanine racemase n=1 Tax=Zhouia amylolytica TaxID=376730 RepID=A0A1I6QNA8_9FLAO|nr:alanine racemase [Zhouia amylolytica]MCQ0111988.1 alanine racemase [Zhouia amylolytica]SFS53957.1 alanine racemase [Zhouia amylolytica]